MTFRDQQELELEKDLWFQFVSPESEVPAGIDVVSIDMDGDVERERNQRRKFLFLAV